VRGCNCTRCEPTRLSRAMDTIGDILLVTFSVGSVVACIVGIAWFILFARP
jgi:hypothetical protein